MSDLTREEQWFPMGAITRFWTNINTGNPDECWPWIGKNCSRGGYGRIWVSGVRWKASRFSWVLHFGAIPDGLWVLHKCDNPPCCNPAHLFLGTCSQNMIDASQKGRLARTLGEKNGNARLTVKGVTEIRRLAIGGHGMAALARRYFVDQKTIWNIVRGVSWKHLLGTPGPDAAGSTGKAP